MRPTDEEIAAVLDAGLDKSRGPDACWLWTGKIDHRGYGTVNVRGEARRVHRIAYELANGSLGYRAWEYVCHRCDTKACANPKHLFLGDETRNAKDAWRKGRMGSSLRQLKTAKHKAKRQIEAEVWEDAHKLDDYDLVGLGV